MSRTRSLFLTCVLVLATACGDDSDGEATPSEEGLNVILSDERPSKRSEVVAVPDDVTDRILMFAGNEASIINQIPGASYLDDTWLFEPGVGWREVEGASPHARGRYGAALDRVEGRALVFGGRYRPAGQSGNYELFGDLWSFDFQDETWTLLDDGSAGGPRPRYYPQVVWSTGDDALYVYGGLTNNDPLAFQRNNELWRWTPDAGWEQRPTSGDGPSPRAFYGSTYDASRDRLLLFAGQIGDFQSLAYNDLFALELSTGEWTELHGGGMSAPFTRMHPHLQYDASRDRLLVFGGHTDIGDDNDLWQFTNDGGWDLIREADSFTGESLGCLGNPSEVPANYVDYDPEAPERRQKAFVAMMHDNIWIFGGMHAECSEHLDDTWRYSLATGDWTELIPARTGESCERRQDDCQCLCL